MTRVLSLRELGRATLARQLLLERSALDPVAAVEHLVGLQAQTPHTWYVGLWSRLTSVDPQAVGAGLEDRRLVRVPLLRSTIHLVGVDRDALAAAARELVEERPRIASELGRPLAEEFSGRDPAAREEGDERWTNPARRRPDASPAQTG